jgi:hypothetical protein
MNRTLRAAGLASLAVAAVAITAASAQATIKFEASAYPATFTGASELGGEAFSTEAGKVECKGHLEGKLTGASTTATITPTYTSCKAFGFAEATMTTTGCTYVLHTTEKVSTGVYRHLIDIACETGKAILISAATCKAEVKGQTGLKSVRTTNAGSNITQQPEVESITYTVTQDGFLCPFKGTGTKNDGKYTGDIALSRSGGGSISVGEGGGGGPTATTLSTSLSGEGKSGEAITVNEGSKVKDTAALSGTNASFAGGTVKYKVYSDSSCKELVTSAGEVTVTSGSVPNSSEVELTAGAVYYWQAEYSGDANNLSSVSTCNKEVLTIKANTSLSTSLSGEGKSGEAITINEGSKAKDTATLSGTNSSKAGGSVKYKVYADSSCKELVTSAGEFTVTSGSVPNSSEVELTAGAVYYWQAEYGGDSLHNSSTSTCNKEVLTVKANTSISTSLSGEGKSGEAITIGVGAKAKDTATLSGTNVSKAGGTVKYKVYADSSCKEIVTSAGEVTVSSGSVPNSSEIKFEELGIYYWQAEYGGDSLHNSSTSTCNKEVLTVKYAVTLSTLLVGEGGPEEEAVEGKEISLLNGAGVADTVTLSGSGSSSATGTVEYLVYSDEECEEQVDEAGEGEVLEGKAEASEELEPEEGVYYWQVVYSGDSLHLGATSACDEVVALLPETTLTTSLAGEGESGAVIEVSEDAAVTDTATLAGENASSATGTVKYKVYADGLCTELVAEAGEVSVSGPSVPPSTPQTLEEGLYYWQAVYSGDEENHASRSECSELELVLPRVTTELTGGGNTEPEIEVLTETPVTEQATLHGENAAEATGTVEYLVYSDEECEELFAEAGEVTVSGAVAPASSEIEFEEPGIYYWKAVYSGDEANPPSSGFCGSSVSAVKTATSLALTLTGGGEEGEEIEVEEGTAVSAEAIISGANAASAEGSVTYTAYSDSGCSEVAELGGVGEVSGGGAEASSEDTLEHGTYYWQAEYSGDAVNQSSTSPCVADEVVTAPITTELSGEGSTGEEIEVIEGAPVTQEATLHGPHAAEATGTLTYSVYSDEACEELFASAGEVTVSGASVPPSNEIEFENEGAYYWRAAYSGDGKNPAATSPCLSAEAWVVDKDWRLLSLGDSFSSGEGARFSGGSFYAPTNVGARFKHTKNICHRSPDAWPALIAEAAFGPASIQTSTVFEKEPPRFVFRACSGAEGHNIWSKAVGANIGGQYDEKVFPKTWYPTPAQANWLGIPGGGGAALPKVGLVTLSIGGNDAGFSKIAQACISVTRLVDVPPYSPINCQAVIALSMLAGFPKIEARLPVILETIRLVQPTAHIRVLLYPRVVHPIPGQNVDVGLGHLLEMNNVVPGVAGMTAAGTVAWFIEQLNEKIRDTVNAAKVPNTQVVDTTVEALRGHRFGDPVPWMNKVVAIPFRTQESFHPSLCGHAAFANRAWAGIWPALPNPIGMC